MVRGDLRAWGIQRMTPGGVRGMRHAVECVGDVKVPGGVRGGLQSQSMQSTVGAGGMWAGLIG